MAKCNTRIDIDRLIKILDVTHPDSVLDNITMHGGSIENYNYAYDEAIAEGMSEEDAEEAALQAEQAALDEVMDQYYAALESAAQDLFGAHGLDVEIPTKKIEGRDVRLLDEIKVSPQTSWKNAAGHIMETINGVGMFVYQDVDEFLESGPYTPCEAVMNHLEWIGSYPEVYGVSSARRRIEGSMRWNNPAPSPTPRANPASNKGLKKKLLR